MAEQGSAKGKKVASSPKTTRAPARKGRQTTRGKKATGKADGAAPAPGRGYAQDVSAFERFLLRILRYHFSWITGGFLESLLGDGEDSLEDLRGTIDRANELWEDYLFEVIDHATYDGPQDLIQEALGNLAPTFADRLHREGVGPYEALAAQIYRYLEERKIAGSSIQERFALWKELESRYS